MDLANRWIPDVTAAAFLLLVIRLTLIGALAHLALALLRRGSAALRHLVATAGLAAMVVVLAAFALGSAWPVWSVPVESLPGLIRSAGSTLAAARPALFPARAASPSARDRVPAPNPEPGTRESWADAAPAAPAHLATPGDPADRARRPAGGAFDPRAMTLALAAAVAAWFAAVHAAAAWWVRRRAAGARDVDDVRVLALLDRARAALGCRARIALRVSPQVRVPFVTGLVRPVLMLPDEAIGWDEARLHAVLLHELAHVVRGDGIALLVARSATTLAWFHPLAWSLARTAHRECERSCDDVVLATGVRPSRYAEDLLAIARAAGRPPMWIAGSLAVAHPGQLEGRLLAILRPDARRRPVSRRAVAVASAAVLALLAPLTTVRLVEASGDGARTKEAAALDSAARERTETLMRLSPDATSHWPEEPAAPITPAPDPIAASPPPSAAAGRLADPDGPAATAFQFAARGSRTGSDWYGAASEHYDAGRFGDAGEFFERAARAGHKAGKAWYNAACSYSLDGQTNRALGALHSAIGEGFDDASAIQSDTDLNTLRNESRFRMMVRDLMSSKTVASARQSAVESLEALNDAGDPDPEALRAVGIELMRSGEPRLAVQAFARQYAIDSTASALYNQACAQTIAGRATDALAALERSILTGYGNVDHLRGDPDLIPLHGRPEFDLLAELAGDLTLDLGDWGKGSESRWRTKLAHYERVARERPELGRAWFNLGFVQLRAGSPDDGHRSFLRALDLGYRRPTTLYNLACTAAQSGDDDESMSWLTRAEKAGFAVGRAAPEDEDLSSLRSDSRFLSMMDRWDRQHPTKKYDRDKNKLKERGGRKS